MAKSRVTILGAGNLGAALGRGLAAAGYPVTFGVRDAAGGRDAVKGGTPVGARVTGLAESVTDADIVILATPAGAIEDVLNALGAALDNRIVVDATNAVGAGLHVISREGGASHAEMTADHLRTAAPRARVVKSFNQVGANVVASAPSFAPPPAMGVAGDDAEARRVVMTLAKDLGFEPFDAGPLERARELESFAMLWIALSAYAGANLGREFAFAIVRR